jgi:hypothetical protein
MNNNNEPAGAAEYESVAIDARGKKESGKLTAVSEKKAKAALKVRSLLARRCLRMRILLILITVVTSFTYVEASVNLIQHDTNLDEKYIAELTLGIDHIGKLFRETGLLDHEFEPTIRLFGNIVAYTDYQKAHSKSSTSSKGFYSRAGREGIINADRPMNEVTKTVYHETCHAFYHAIVDRPPPWIDEGLAEVFEMMEIKTNHSRINAQEWRVKRLRKLLNDNALPSLTASISRTNEEWSRLSVEGMQDVRNISWAVFHILLKSDSGRVRIVKLLTETSKSPRLDNAELLRELIRADNLEPFEKIYRKAIFSNDLQPYELTLPN